MDMNRAPHNILVLTYWDVQEPLIVNYTLPYVRMMVEELPKGSTIHLVTLDRSVGQPRKPLSIAGVVHHSFTYSPFGWRAVGMMAKLLFSLVGLVYGERIHSLHAWCTPAGAVGYLLSRLTGRPLVVDSYEPHAEAMVENGTWQEGGLAHRILFQFERLQTSRASAVIAATEGMRDYATRRYGQVPKHFFVKPACVDLERFSWRQVKRPDLLAEFGFEEKLVAVYAGKFGGIYLEREVFDLLRVARDYWGERLHVLLLTAHAKSELLPLMEGAGLPPDMFTVYWAAPNDVPDMMGLADLALTPVKPVPTKRYCTPIKDGEYWALGLPVMITAGISDDSEIIERHGIGSVVRTLDANGYRRAVVEMDALLSSGDRSAIYKRIRPIAEQYRHESVARHIYRELYGPMSIIIDKSL